MNEDLVLNAIAQIGFPISVSIFLLWKGYTQDQKFLDVLLELKDEIKDLRRERL